MDAGGRLPPRRPEHLLRQSEADPLRCAGDADPVRVPHRGHRADVAGGGPPGTAAAHPAPARTWRPAGIKVPGMSRRASGPPHQRDGETAGGELRAEDVSFAYLGAPRAALRHVDLGVTPGEVVLLTGASGCGKSTLALALCGLIPSRVHGELRGRVTFAGQPLSGLPPHEASQLVGLVFQNPNQQLINQTVQSEVAFGPENLALPQPEIAARVNWCLDVTGMAGMRTAAVVTLSGGQKQRTAIAATLAMRPGILVLDEPLSDLDPVGAQEVLAALQRLARDGGTGVIIIEHRVDEVAPWADRVVLMDDGRVILNRPPRAAWAEHGPWRAAGVGIPDIVRLAHAVPGAFASRLPLSVDEAVEDVKGTWFETA